MVLLHLAFQDGFDNDLVNIQIDSKKVPFDQRISTDYRIGLAGRYEERFHPGTRNINIQIPEKGLSTTFEVNLLRDTYIAISIEEGKLKHIEQYDPFGYL